MTYSLKALRRNGYGCHDLFFDSVTLRDGLFYKAAAGLLSEISVPDRFAVNARLIANLFGKLFPGDNIAVSVVLTPRAEIVIDLLGRLPNNAVVLQQKAQHRVTTLHFMF